MAELAIPIVALGALYIISNQDKKNKLTNNKKLYTEGYESMNSDYDNTNKVYTDKYFDATNYSNISSQDTDGNGVGNNTQEEVSTMTGDSVNKTDFTHNNMVPYFGGKIKGSTTSSTSDYILDNKQGSGSLYTTKEENTPLFKPEDNVSWQYGTPSYNDFYQSRVNVSNTANNVSMCQPELVGPGLKLGYGNEGGGGFNAGLVSTNTYCQTTVDDLRTKNNPKESYAYNNPQGPAINKIQNMGQLGKVEKHLPEKYYENTPDRWFTTTGVENKPTIRSELLLKDENRQTTNLEYYGTGNNTKSTNYAKPNYRESTKTQFKELNKNPAALTGKNYANVNEYGAKSYQNLNNNRSTTQNQLDFGGVSGLVSSLMAPINNILRPTRKDNIVGNLRQYGNVNNINNNNGGYILENNDVPKTTIKEMNVDRIDMNYLNVQAKNRDGIDANKHTPIHNQRDTTNINYVGGANSQSQAMRNTKQEYLGTTNNNKSYESRINQGGTSFPNYSVNVETYKQDKDRDNNRMWVPQSNMSVIPNRDFMGSNQTVPFEYPNVSCDRLDANLLSAFKNNPYTQKLTSVA